ncbi:MAG: hypothetical protein ACYTA3_13405, partial [Planctomycetota bacterium]
MFLPGGKVRRDQAQLALAGFLDGPGEQRIVRLDVHLRLQAVPDLLRPLPGPGDGTGLRLAAQPARPRLDLVTQMPAQRLAAELLDRYHRQTRLEREAVVQPCPFRQVQVLAALQPQPRAQRIGLHGAVRTLEDDRHDDGGVEEAVVPLQREVVLPQAGQRDVEGEVVYPRLVPLQRPDRRPARGRAGQDEQAGKERWAEA